MTLLKQHISGIRTSGSSNRFDEGIGESDAADAESESSNTAEAQAEECPRSAETVCGPVEMSKYVDLSGTQGIVPLTSVSLLKAKSKSFLLHLKAKSVPDRIFEKVSSQVSSVDCNVMLIFNLICF